jgi:peptidoglycan/LPS O-acetylase OafA/YrhL
MASQRLESLDSIRGLAALAVLLGHTLAVFNWPEIYTSWSQWPIFNMIVDGRSAVTMFFVLSGFVLARPFLILPGKAMYVPAFYLRRIARIWLPWFFVFLASLAACRWLMFDGQTNPPASSWLTGFWHESLSWKDLGKQLIFQLHDPSRLLLPQDWSLGVELKGSALMPIFLIMARQRLYWLWFGICALLFFIFIPTGSYYISFIIGVLLARHAAIWVEKLKTMGFQRKLTLLLLGIAGYETRWFLNHFDEHGRWADQSVWIVTSFGCAMIILASLSSRRIGGFLIKRPLLFVGQVSYSVYLLQFIVLICFTPVIIHQLNFTSISILGLFIAALSSSFALTLALAWMVYRCVEIPSITLGHWLSRHVDLSKAASNQPVKN